MSKCILTMRQRINIEGLLASHNEEGEAQYVKWEVYKKVRLGADRSKYVIDFPDGSARLLDSVDKADSIEVEFEKEEARQLLELVKAHKPNVPAMEWWIPLKDSLEKAEKASK